MLTVSDHLLDTGVSAGNTRRSAPLSPVCVLGWISQVTDTYEAKYWGFYQPIITILHTRADFIHTYRWLTN